MQKKGEMCAIWGEKLPIKSQSLYSYIARGSLHTHIHTSQYENMNLSTRSRVNHPAPLMRCRKTRHAGRIKGGDIQQQFDRGRWDLGGKTRIIIDGIIATATRYDWTISQIACWSHSIDDLEGCNLEIQEYDMERYTWVVPLQTEIQW